MKELVNSTLPNEVLKRIVEGLGFGWSLDMTSDTIQDYLQASVKFLATKKNKDKAVALELRDLNGGFHFATIVQFVPQTETGADEGSWSLSFTFEESDVDKSWDVYNFAEDPEAKTVFYNVAYSAHGISWRFRELENTDEIANASVIQLTCLLFDSLRDYMTLNASIDPDLQIGELITFHAEMAQDKIYIGVDPGFALKQLVKNDATVAKVAA